VESVAQVQGKKGKPDSKARKRRSLPEKSVDAKYAIEIPVPLRAKLVEDYHYIARQKYLINLPRNPSVLDILRAYLPEQTSPPQPLKTSVNEIILGIRAYFDKALGTLLLYRFERKQYSDVLRQYPGKNVCEIYGVEHLLRFLVKMPELLCESGLDEESTEAMKWVLSDLIGFITKNIEVFAPTTAVIFEPASPQYIKSSS